MSKNSQHVASPTAPAWLSPIPILFVLIWSTGFIVAKFGLPFAPPLTFLILRCCGALVFLIPCVLIWKAPWPNTAARGHIAVAGLLLQAGYLSGVWTAIKLGMPAGLAALIVGMQPILTAAFAPLIGEKVRPRQWLGLVFGLTGVALVVAAKISLVGLSPAAIVASLLALVAITAGTMYQRHYCPRFDLRTGTVIQYAASAALILPFAIWVEGFSLPLTTVEWTPRFIGALLWSVLALSIGAIFLLFKLLGRSDATQVTSLLYLTPPTTAIMAWIMFGEVFNLLGMLGMAVAVMGVIFVVKK
jgi:drug/metabolite transporter (DMT)-like permease